MAVIKTLPYQQKLLKDPSRHILVMWSRGARKTFTTTLKLVIDCFEHEAKGQKVTWVILSRGERQALEAISTAKNHCNALLFKFGSRTSQFVSEDGTQRYTQHEIRFPSGSRIIALPANPDTARGYSANLLLDEFGIHDNSVEIWTALYPILRGKYKVIVASTPHGGREQMFYQIAHDESGLWSRHITDVYQAVAQGLNLNIEEEKAGMKNPDGWKQEYELQWLDESAAWLPFDLITSCEHHECGDTGNYMGGPCYVGVDVARRNNLWVAWVLERVGDVLWTREIVTLDSNSSFDEHRHHIARIIKNYRVARMAIDKNGMGEDQSEWAVRNWGGMVDPVVFNSGSKHAMANIGKIAFEGKKVRIPAGDTEIREDLYSLRKFDGVVPKFDTAQGAGKTGSHADRTWALFLALQAAKEGDGHAYAASTGKSATQAYARSVNIIGGASARSSRKMVGLL